MMTLPRSVIASKVGEPSSETSVATVQGTPSPVSSSPPLPPGLLGVPLLHAVSASRAAAAMLTPANILVRLMGFLLIFLVVRRASWALGLGRYGSVGDELRQEVAGSIALRVREELLGRRLLDDAAVGHEHDAVGRFAGEAHLVGDDDHRHAV